jgi:hypothetical protein
MHKARISMDIPQIADPSLSQNLLLRRWTKMNMKDKAEANLTIPKIPVRKRDDETEVKPEDMKMVGASMLMLVC